MSTVQQSAAHRARPDNCLPSRCQSASALASLQQQIPLVNLLRMLRIAKRGRTKRDTVRKMSSRLRSGSHEATKIITAESCGISLSSAVLNTETECSAGQRPGKMEVQLHRMQELTHCTRIARKPLLKALIIAVTDANVELGEVHGAPAMRAQGMMKASER